MESTQRPTSSAFSPDCSYETDFSGAVIANVVLNSIRPFALPQEDYDSDVLEAEPPALILYNDEVNTFEHVIVSLVDVCGHEEIQAEQCAWIVHTRGRCIVKEGSSYELEPMADALCRRGLSANVE
jgi:ATP-dependent Clp protease adaptor protein ClpS